MMNQGSHSIQSGSAWFVGKLKGGSSGVLTEVRRLGMVRVGAVSEPVSRERNVGQ